jgi:hypothetical protein
MSKRGSNTQSVAPEISGTEVIDTDQTDAPDADQTNTPDADQTDATDVDPNLVALTNGTETVLAHPTQVAQWEKQGWTELEDDH